MPFENLGDKLQSAFKDLRGKGKLSESDIDGALREVRRALLEADVNFKVAKDFIAHVREKAMGEEVFGSLKPDQTVIKIVKDELTELLGGTQSKITLSSSGMTIIMLVGLQGAGKTTTAGKLALMFKKKGHRPMMAACDVYRPAAIKQLEVLGEQTDVPVYRMPPNVDPVHIAQYAIDTAKAYNRDVVILDTAGRLTIDEKLMAELRNIKAEVHPHEILLVLDSMTGQDAVNTAKAFDENLGIDGTILTKMDGDARGGAALSIKTVTGKPIKMIGVSEKLDGGLVDPMLATGGSAVAAIDMMKEKGVKNIKFMCLVAAPEGVEVVNQAHPDVPIYTASLDRQLNEKKYILPGLGDAGDRIFGTK